MKLNDALKLVRSGGRVALDTGRVEMSQIRGMLIVTIKEQPTILSETQVRKMYWDHQWVAQ